MKKGLSFAVFRTLGLSITYQSQVDLRRQFFVKVNWSKWKLLAINIQQDLNENYTWSSVSALLSASSEILDYMTGFLWKGHLTPLRARALDCPLKCAHALQNWATVRGPLQQWIQYSHFSSNKMSWPMSWEYSLQSLSLDSSMKHGGDSVMIWGLFSCIGVGLVECTLWCMQTSWKSVCYFIQNKLWTVAGGFSKAITWSIHYFLLYSRSVCQEVPYREDECLNLRKTMYEKKKKKNMQKRFTVMMDLTAGKYKSECFFV